MKNVLLSVAMAGLCSTAIGNVISYGGVDYETIDWTNVSSLTNIANGTVGGVGVTFETVNISNDTITNNSYGSDTGFDELLFGEGPMGSVQFFGGVSGTSQLTFDQTVGSVLMLIGSPNDDSTQTQFGAAIWDFDDGFQMELVDSEAHPGLELVEGNLVSNVITGPTTHQSGVLSVLGDLDSIGWTQDTSNGVDEMMITFAVAPATIPAPATGLALLLPAAMMGRRRR
jgi:hypothetical protein